MNHIIISDIKVKIILKKFNLIDKLMKNLYIKEFCLQNQNSKKLKIINNIRIKFQHMIQKIYISIEPFNYLLYKIKKINQNQLQPNIY